MEAVPKVPMLNFNLKHSQQKSSFSRLKQYIAECYQEDPETFSKEIYELETLRAAAYNPPIDVAGCNLIKRYYCQLHSLQNRFPLENDRHLVSFNWREIYSGNSTQSTDLRYDMAVVLYNYGALHTQLGSSVNRTTEEEMKLACTHFQCAAWAFETVREKYQLATTGDLYPDVLIFMQNISFAQAQECILEKSLIDSRKSIIVAKVTAQIIEYYNSAFAALLSGGEEGIIAEIVGSKLFKEWRQYIQFKVQYMSCILLLYQGQHAEEQQKMGERVILYQAAFDRLEEARKEAKHMNNLPQVNEALAFVMDVVEAKRKAAKNENEFIYHEEVPELSSIATVPGANLVKGIAFNVADPAVTAEDIFHRLIPIKTHENSSLYSEEKANLLRTISQKIESKDNDLNKFMESLNIDSLNYDSGNVKLPQSLIDRCADLNAKPNAIPELISKMSSLAEICVDVENMLQSIQELLSKEEFYEKDFQQTMGYRPSSHFIELNREFMKYQEAHNRAGESNDTLRKAMELHVNNLKILAKPLAEVQAAIPTCSAEINPIALNETRMLLNKVNEMRVQRAQLHAQLNENIQKDDITTQLIAWGDNDVEKLFKTELAKHEKLISIIEQNMVAQGYILKLFTDAYAKCAHFIKAVADTKHKRDIFFSSLIASYDVYDDLLGKSLKGLEFYKKLQSNIHKLCARVRSARDVHDEERQQRLESINKKMSSVSATPALSGNDHEYPGVAKSAADYEKYDSYRSSAIRPTPIGQENTAIPSACVTSMSYDINNGATTSTHLPHNYTPSLAASVPPNYSLPSATSSEHYVANKAFTAPATISHSNQQNTLYNPSISQLNAYSVSSGYSNTNTVAGFVNPIYDNFPTSMSTDSSKMYYGEKSAAVVPSSISNSNAQYANPNVYATNTPINQYNYNPVANISSAEVFQPQTYLNYTQPETASPSISYSASQYVPPHQSATQPYSQEMASSVYQISNPNSNQNFPLNQMYQMYQQPNNQYSDPRYSTQSQIYSHTDTQLNYDQQQQQQPTPSVSSQYGYATVYSQQPLQESIQTPQSYGYQHQSGANVPTNDTASSYVNSDGAHNYYNIQYPVANETHSNQFYSNPANVQNSPYSMPTETIATSNHSTHNYSAPSNVNYSIPSMSSQLNSNSNYYDTNTSSVSVPVTASPVNNYTTPVQQTTLQANQAISNPSPNYSAETATAKTIPEKSNFDLLSDLDNISIPAPTLQPIKSDAKPPPVELETDKTSAIKSSVGNQNEEKSLNNTPNANKNRVSLDSSNSIDKALTELSLSEELLNTPVVDAPSKPTDCLKTDAQHVTATVTTSTTSSTTSIPPSSVNIETFYKEVQRYEKIVNTLTTKTLNGTTPLETKWKELNDLLEKDSNKRSVAISKLFPEKNRNMLSVPYDHSRVLLPTETDNYINAAHVRDLSPQFNHFILADAPTFNTIKDFWCMVCSQQSKYVICLSTPEEAQSLLFPRQLNVEQTFGEYTVSVLTEQNRLHVIERNVRITSTEANSIQTITVFQAKQWPTKNSISNIIGVSQNIIDAIKANADATAGPIVLNCLTNLERSSIVALTITCILGLEADTPTIINASDVWYRISSQRKNILNDAAVLQQTMQIILQCCREFIKKKSPKTLANNTQINYYFIQEEEETTVKDPFKDLDPLWKLK